MAKDTSNKKKYGTYGSYGSGSKTSSSSPAPASKPRRVVEVRNAMNQAVMTYRFVDDASKPSGKRMKQIQIPGRGPERNFRMPEEDITKHMRSLVERQLLRLKTVMV